MAKSKSKKKSNVGLIINVVIIALAVLTVFTLFMPVLNRAWLTANEEISAVSIKGADIFSGTFASETTKGLSDGAKIMYGLRIAEENSFIVFVMSWGYIITVIASVVTLAFAVLNVLGMRFKLVNTVLGVVLAVLAVVTFIFALVVASKSTDLLTVAGYSTGTKYTAAIASYFMFATVIAGGLEVYKARQK